MATTFTVEIDWDHDGTWTDETARTRRAHIRSGFDGAGDGISDNVAGVGRCTLTLDNSTQRFSPGYASGALYGDLLPRREVKVTATDGVTTWTLFRGFIGRIVPAAGEYGEGTCVLECVDAMAILARQRVGVVLEDSKAVDEAVSAVVNLGYSPPATSYSDNDDSLSHYGRAWLPERTTAMAALREICEAVYGRFYIDRDGTATFITRDDQLDSSGDAAISVGVYSTYWERVRDAQLANLLALWRLNEEAGSEADDSSANDYDGVYSGVTLDAWDGPDGFPAPTFDAINDYVDVYSAGLAGDFDGAELTVLLWIKVTDGSVWTGSAVTAMFFRVNSTNYFEVTIRGDGPTLMIRRAGGGVTSQVTSGSQSSTDWLCVVFTVSEAADEMKMFIDGVQEGSTQTGLGAWTGALSSTVCTLGSRNQLGNQVFDGGVALVGVWDAALSESKIASLGSV